MYIRITIIAYFLTDTLNRQVLWGKKYLLKSLHEKLKDKVSLKQMLIVKNLSLPRTKKTI